MLRKIDRFVDLSDLRAHLGPYYSDVGRPSIDPELMIRMLIVGYGIVTLRHRERKVSAAQELLGRYDCRPPRVHRRGAKRAVRLS